MKPSTFANLVSTSLYEKRFGPYFVTPIVVGIEENKPFICTYDSIGSIDKDNFAGFFQDIYLFQSEALLRNSSKDAVNRSIKTDQRKMTQKKFWDKFWSPGATEMLSVDGEELSIFCIIFYIAMEMT